VSPAKKALYQAITRALLAVLAAWNKYLQEEGEDKDK